MNPAAPSDHPPRRDPPPQLVPDSGEEPATRPPDLRFDTTTPLGHSCASLGSPYNAQQSPGRERPATRPPRLLQNAEALKEPGTRSGGPACSSGDSPEPGGVVSLRLRPAVRSWLRPTARARAHLAWGLPPRARPGPGDRPLDALTEAAWVSGPGRRASGQG